MFDGRARTLLMRAYANPGTWQMTRISDPGPRTRAQFRAQGIDVEARDKGGSAVGGRSGGRNARTRWIRGMVRAVYYQHKWYSGGGTKGWRTNRRTAPRETGAIRFEVGRHMPAVGLIPAGHAFRLMLDKGGVNADRAVTRLSDRDRIFTDDGGQGRRWSDPGLRDWA